MEQLQQIYQHYTEELDKVQTAASPIAGIFGTGGSPKDHPCHTQFFESVGRWVENFLSSEPNETDMEEATRYLLLVGTTHRNRPTYWFCFAAQTHAKALIPLLSQSHCEALRQDYEQAYSDADHMPLYWQICNLLRTHARVAPKKRRFGFRHN